MRHGDPLKALEVEQAAHLPFAKADPVALRYTPSEAEETAA